MIKPESLVGEFIDNRYRLSAFLGDGAFGWAFAAEELVRGEVTGYCALKFLRPKTDAERDSVTREIRSISALSHGRLVAFRGTGEVKGGPLDGCLYLAMELGQHSLAQHLQRPERMSAEEVHQVALHICEALAYLHGQGVVHRDVKPANVFRVGDSWKLGDFGLVRGVEASKMTASGMKGTPLYLAPEAVQGQVGPSVDVWALGVVVHECLTGRFPYTAETEYAFVAELLTADPKIASGLPTPLDGFVRRSLERAREQRWRAEEALAFLASPGTGAVPNVRAQQSSIATTSRPAVVSVPAQPTSPSVRLPAGLRFIGKNAQGFDEAENEKDGTVLIRIPAGTFIMGSNEYDDEKPPHAVTVTDYWMAKTTVTNAQFRRFVQATRHNGAGGWERYARQWGDDCPVVEVSWHDAVAYSKWAGLRLPSEAEWEYAARGPEGLVYPWGNKWDASKCRNSVAGVLGSAGQPVAVGSYPAGASPFGCLDLAGNVWEWCSSKYAPYPYEASDGRESPSGDDRRVLRGGSWSSNDPHRFRGASRVRNGPTFSNDDWGFRSARTS